MSRLKEHYEKNIKPKLKEEFKYSNDLMVPRLEKIVLNMGVGKASQDRKHAENASRDLTLIAGQKALLTKAKKSIAGFKLREDMGVGVKVTLRKKRMYEFLDRLINIAMPRIRDFRGISPKSFDGHGNYAMGIKEHIIFPEIDYDKIDEIKGMDIVFVTSAETDEQALALLKAFNMPFTK